jgi:hypothetical protein
MAVKGLYRILFQNSANSPFVSGDIVTVYTNTATADILVYKNGSPITSGPTLGDESYIQYWRNGPPETIINYSVAPIDDSGNVNLTRPDVQYCSGSDLIHFDKQTTFPYAAKLTDANNPNCLLSAVCDIHFIGPGTVVRPSTSISFDGSIQVEAVSSAGTVAYSMNKSETYATMTNTTGLFTGLYAATHVIYAKDSRGCGAEITVELVRADNYHTKWRLAYNDLNGWSTRVDIQELDYSGSVIEVIGGSEPFTLSLRGENKNLFDQVFSTEAVINLLSETNFQFLELFTQDDRKYKIIFYKNTGSGLNAVWSGWITPGLYQEEYYSDSNYEISANATDNLTTLSEIKFSDTNIKGRVSAIQIIAGILKKINLGLDINVACDLYENAFYTSAGQQFQNTGFTTTILPWVSVHPTTDTEPMAPFSYDSGSDSITATDGSSHTTEWIIQAPLAPQQVWPAGSYTFRVTGINRSVLGIDVAEVRIMLGAFDDPVTISNFIQETTPQQFAADNTEYTKDISFVLTREYRYIGFQFRNTRTPQAVNFTLNSITIQTIDTGVSPFYQTYIDVDNTYYDDQGESNTCLEVLSDILKIFAARIYQWNNAWNIDCLYMKSAAYDYHRFNLDGNYYAGTVNKNAIVDFKKSTLTNRGVWVNTSQNLEIISAIGKASVTYKLKKNEFGFVNGGFETYTPPTKLPGYIRDYKNWNIVQNGNIASYGYINALTSQNIIQGKDSNTKMLLISDESNSTYGEDAYIISENNPITFSASDAIKFSFDFYADEYPQPLNFVENVKFKWSLKIGSYFLQPDATWTTDTTKEWVEVDVNKDKFNDWNTVEISNLCPQVSATTTTVFSLKLMHGGFSGTGAGTTWQYTALTGANSIESIATPNLPIGYTVCFNGTISETYGLITITYQAIGWYVLTSGNTTTSTPNSIRPSDYDEVSGNVVYWKLVSMVKINNGGSRSTNLIKNKKVTINSFDNVKVEFLPYGQEPPEEKVYTSVNDPNFKENIEVETLVGDAPPDITNASSIYKNYLTHADGTPTYGWARVGFSEFLPILSLLAKQIVEHYKKPKFKLTGSFTTDTWLGFDATLRDGSRVFLPMGMTIKDKMNEYDVEIHEFETVDGNSTNPFDSAEFVTSEFGPDFNI